MNTKTENSSDNCGRTAASLLIKHGWRCHWSMPSPKDFTQPFTMECWAKGGRVMMLQGWKENNGCVTYFAGGGETWEQLEVELARDQNLPPADAPHPDLAGSKPLVLYFPDEQARTEFVEMVKQAKPNMVTKEL